MSNRKNSNIPIWLIVLGLIFFWPFGIILLFLYLGGTNIPGFSPPKKKPGRPSKKIKSAHSGRGMTIGGGVLTALGGITFLSEILTYGFSFPADWFPLLGMTIGGLVLTGFGVSRARFSRRQRLYLQAIGRQEAIYLSDLAGTAGVTEKQATEDVQKMLADHLLPTGYIDRATGRLILSEQGIVHDPLKAEKAAEAARQAAEAKAQSQKQQPADPDADLLRQIQAINDAIPDEEMSAKIDRIWDITHKILNYQREHPEKAPQLRQFLNYYLPTTLRLLKTYARLDEQGVEGANITAAKSHIEGMMDKVVEGFEKQLDQLFRTDAMDIAADVEVLERMLEKDGLSGEDFGGLTL